MAALEFYISGQLIWLPTQRGSQISIEREKFGGGTAVLPRLCESLKRELSHLNLENAMLKADYLQQVVGIILQGIPTVLEVHYLCWFMPLRENTIPRRHMDELVWPNEKSSGSSRSDSQLPTPEKHVFCVGYSSARYQFGTSSSMESKVQHLVPRLPCTSS